MRREKGEKMCHDIGEKDEGVGRGVVAWKKKKKQKEKRGCLHCFGRLWVSKWRFDSHIYLPSFLETH